MSAKRVDRSGKAASGPKVAPASPPSAQAAPEIVQQLEPFVPPERIGEAAQVVSMMIAQSHSGPLPPAREFANYDRALPGAAERILNMAEKEQTHRHQIEREVVRREIGFKTTGQIFAFIALLLMLGSVLALALLGHATEGAWLGGAVIVGVVALFLGQRWIPGEKGKPPSDADGLD